MKTYGTTDGHGYTQIKPKISYLRSSAFIGGQILSHPEGPGTINASPTDPQTAHHVPTPLNPMASALFVQLGMRPESRLPCTKPPNHAQLARDANHANQPRLPRALPKAYNPLSASKLSEKRGNNPCGLEKANVTTRRAWIRPCQRN